MAAYGAGEEVWGVCIQYKQSIEFLSKLSFHTQTGK